MKTNIKQRIISIVVAFACVLSVISTMTAFASNEVEDFVATETEEQTADVQEDVASIEAVAAVTPSETVGGWNMVDANSTVTSASGSKIGSVSAGEGVTLMSVSGSKAYIEYSASGKAKQGYIPANNLLFGKSAYPGSRVGKVTANKTTYYSPNTSLECGSLSTGEYISILGKRSGWYYIEYNVTSTAQRKRAFTPARSVTVYGSGIAPKFIQDSAGESFIGSPKILQYYYYFYILNRKMIFLSSIFLFPFLIKIAYVGLAK